MPSEVKQRKKPQKQGEEVSETSAAAKSKDEAVRQIDLRSLLCLLSLAACAGLSWFVLQQNERVYQMEEKYKFLQGKTSSLFDMEERVLKVSEKLSSSEVALQTAARLQRDLSAVHSVVEAMQGEESAASRELQAVNSHFFNVTETWQQRLSAVSADLSELKSQSREAHAGATEQVNEAERRARALAERLEELEDSTRRNARLMESTEQDDAKRTQAQLDWNTKQVQKLEQLITGLAKSDSELSQQLQDHVPRAQECQEQLPRVEEAVRSILRLAGDLSAAEKRVEEVTLQVFGTEDSMLKALSEILDIRQELDTMQTQNSILKMKNELSVVKEAVRELAMVLKDGGGGATTSPGDPTQGQDGGEDQEDNWEEWEREDGTSLHDDLTE